MATTHNDPAHIYTDDEIERLEKLLAKHYRQAAIEARKRLDDYFRQFESKDKEMLKLVKAGEMTQEAYNNWRTMQMATGQRWDILSRNLSNSYYAVDRDAVEIIREATPRVYAENYNYNTYIIENQLKMDTSFTLYNADAVNRMALEPPQSLYNTKLLNGAANKAYHVRKIQSETIQAILLGKSIPQFARGIATALGVSDMHAATTYARTMMTHAQNQGRYDAHKRAQNMGIDCQMMWVATLDGRTRHSHAVLDGETTDENGKFGNGLRFPADTENGTPADWINCRCRAIDIVDGIKPDFSFRSIDDLGGMSYDEWKEWHRGKMKREKDSSKASNTVNLRSAYEYHRTKNNLRVVPFADMKESFWTNDLSKLSAESQTLVTKTMNNLIGKYDTRLQGVGMFTAKEALSTIYARVQSDYAYDKAVMYINPVKFKKKTTLVNAMTDRKKQRYIPKIPSHRLAEYVITHEFGHTLINMGEKLNNKTNWVGADYAKVKRVRKEINAVYESYTQEVSRLEKIKKSEEMKVILGEKDMSVFKAKQAAKEYDDALISKYSMSNADEFVADSFALCELGGDNPYAKKVYKILLREFGR